MTDRPPDLILLGPPGSGKSTHAAELARRLGLVHLSPGALFREMAAEDSEVGRRIRDLIAKGSLVPDDETNQVVRERLTAIPREQGTVFDGYPRNAAQAEAMRRVFEESGRLRPRPFALRLDVPEGELVNRLLRRRDLEGRRDDTDEVIAPRLQKYHAEIAPLMGAISDWADVVTVNGAQPADAVTGEIIEKLDPIASR